MYRLIVITSPDIIQNEAEVINTLFQSGLHCLHIRKPAFSKAEMILLIENISPKNRSKLMIHSFHELAMQYEFGGIHLTNSYLGSLPETEILKTIKHAQTNKFKVSSSVHNFEDIKNMKYNFDYVFLSPVFHSISKQNYNNKFSLFEFNNFLKTHHSPCKIIALGGISKNNIESLFQAGFQGAAVLGAIWQEPNQLFAFEQIKNKIQFSE